MSKILNIINICISWDYSDHVNSEKSRKNNVSTDHERRHFSGKMKLEINICISWDYSDHVNSEKSKKNNVSTDHEGATFQAKWNFNGGVYFIAE